jgi:hypothetical protein
MNNAIKRSIMRWTHLFASVPILSYIYGKPSEVQQYATPVRFVFVPVIVLSGVWMYAGVTCAIIGVVLWVGAFAVGGFWAAVLSQIALFIARKVWMKMRARNMKRAGAAGVTAATP